jgi:hypothetical protein
VGAAFTPGIHLALERDGRLNTGDGIIATVIALVLGFLSLLGVLAFHFPEYLTTPQLRHQYSVDVLRQALLVTLLIAGGPGAGLAAEVSAKHRKYSVLKRRPLD